MIDVELDHAPLREWLRSKTQKAHDRADVAFGALLQEGAPGLQKLLTAHALAAPALCSQIRMQPSLPFAGDFNPTEVNALLALDLERLGATAPTPGLIEGFTTAAECAGAAYTLAGSRLGSKMIARQWRAKFPDSGFSSFYLDHENLFGDWRTFCSGLNGLEEISLNRNLILNGALAAFALFETACDAAIAAQLKRHV
jgi:heme oxygenase (biliverdin-IX-beta and delta-forming)